MGTRSMVAWRLGAWWGWGPGVWWPGDYEYGGLGTRSMVAWGLGAWD